MRELISDLERSNGYGVRREGVKRGKTFYQVSPKNLARREKKASADPGTQRVYHFECRYCHKIFPTTNPHLRFCCDVHRTRCNHVDILDGTRDGGPRHRYIEGLSKWPHCGPAEE